jgi:hypothetical protein
MNFWENKNYESNKKIAAKSQFNGVGF